MEKNTIILSEQDLHEMVREAVNILINENVNQTTFIELAEWGNIFSSIEGRFRDQVMKYRGSELAKKMANDAKFNKFVNNVLWPFLQSLIAAIQRCLRAKTLNEGVKSWVLNTLQDSGIEVPKFIRDGVYGADQAARQIGGWMNNKFGIAPNGNGAMLQSGNAKVIKLSQLMDVEYKNLKNTLEKYSNQWKMTDADSPLIALKVQFEHFQTWWNTNYTRTT